MPLNDNCNLLYNSGKFYSALADSCPALTDICSPDLRRKVIDFHARTYKMTLFYDGKRRLHGEWLWCIVEFKNNNKRFWILPDHQQRRADLEAEFKGRAQNEMFFSLIFFFFL